MFRLEVQCLCEINLCTYMNSKFNWEMVVKVHSHFCFRASVRVIKLFCNWIFEVCMFTRTIAFSNICRLIWSVMVVKWKFDPPSFQIYICTVKTSKAHLRNQLCQWRVKSCQIRFLIEINDYTIDWQTKLLHIIFKPLYECFRSDFEHLIVIECLIFHDLFTLRWCTVFTIKKRLTENIEF